MLVSFGPWNFIWVPWLQKMKKYKCGVTWRPWKSINCFKRYWANKHGHTMPCHSPVSLGSLLSIFLHATHWRSHWVKAHLWQSTQGCQRSLKQTPTFLSIWMENMNYQSAHLMSISDWQSGVNLMDGWLMNWQGTGYKLSKTREQECCWKHEEMPVLDAFKGNLTIQAIAGA